MEAPLSSSSNLIIIPKAFLQLAPYFLWVQPWCRGAEEFSWSEMRQECAVIPSAPRGHVGARCPIISVLRAGKVLPKLGTCLVLGSPKPAQVERRNYISMYVSMDH